MALRPPFFVAMNEELKNRVREIAEPLVEQSGLEIWGLQMEGNPPKNVTLFVEKPAAGENGEISATIDQCEDISRKLGLALDVEDCMPGPWVLEVSSPGFERRFFNLAQMRNYIGDMVEAQLVHAIPVPGQNQKRSLWKGRLLEVGDNYFVIKPCQISQDGLELPENLAPVKIDWENCRRVKRVYVFQPPQRPGKGQSRKQKKS